jgi:hypothetical protein
VSHRAVRKTASQWLKRLYRLSGHEITPETSEEIDREARRVEESWNNARSKNASRCTLTDAQFFIARQHGFASWPRFSKHITDYAAPTQRSPSSKPRSKPSSEVMSKH